MHARTTTLVAMPSSVDAGIAYARDAVMPKVESLDGYVGLSLVADRSSGRCIITTAWESEEAMRASGDAVKEVRARAAEIFVGSSLDVDEWEIAALHRVHESGDGACVRITWVKVDPAEMDAGIDMFKSTVLPALEELDGLCSVSLLVNRASGRGVSSAAFESVEALERAQTQADRIRASASEGANAEVLDEHDFELVIAQLRVPEMV
jgi:heme-degrading monooxygenase HmoA